MAGITPWGGFKGSAPSGKDFRILTPRDIAPRTAPAHITYQKTTDIVGWLFNDEYWHVPCVLIAIEQMQNPRGKGLTVGHVSSMIKQYGRFKNLANDDPLWRDSHVIPQPIFSAEVLDPDNGQPLYDCYACGEEIDPAWPL